VIPARAAVGASGLFASLACLAGCGGGTPLLHPARTLPSGDIRVAGGVSANIATGSLADDLAGARENAARDPNVPGPPGSNPGYAKGALVAAAIAPGLAPFVGARVGVGGQFEGGLAYTGRAVRADMRRSFDDGNWSLSLGLGVSGTLLGRQQGTELPNVDLRSLHGFGFDLPILAGWESTGGLYKVWGGVRGGFERDVLELVTSEPKPLPAGVGPIRLEADRGWGGGVIGFATGFRHVHVALELSVAYQIVSGSYNATDVTIRGLTVAPATALWWSF